MPEKKTALIAGAALLARREHSRDELRQKLKQRGYAAAEIDAALARLRETDLQSDERFCDSYLRGACRRYGNQRLRYDLRQRGCADDLIDAAMEKIPAETERATAIARDWRDSGARIRNASDNSDTDGATERERAKNAANAAKAQNNRVRAALYRKGFSADAISAAMRAALNSDTSDDEDNYAP